MPPPVDPLLIVLIFVALLFFFFFFFKPLCRVYGEPVTILFFQSCLLRPFINILCHCSFFR